MWRFEKKLAAGGMGEVFLARTPEGQRVAVKISSLQQEVSLLVKLRHPSIVSILGCSSTSKEILGEEKGPCYWMEYIEGQDVLSAARKASKPQILDWFRQALEALHYLHSQGVLHGDLSPGNVLIDQSGRLKLVDFGVAGFMGSGTAPIQDAATLPYMAPEKIDGQALPASDLYSLGTVFYEALAGVHPRAGSRSLQDFIQKQPKALGDSIAERVIERTIRAELGERFSQAAEALDALSGGNPESVGPITDYHSAKMLGAEKHFLKIDDVLRNTKTKPFLVCIHGTTGVGKSRFLREIGFQCALSGVKIQILPSLEKRSQAELVSLFRFREMSAGELVVLEWNDDGIAAGCEIFFRHVLAWPQAVEIHLRNLNRPESLEFLKGALGNWASGAVDPLFDQTGGNPLLLSELTRCLLEKRAQTKKPFSKSWLSGLKGLQSLEDILLHRLAGLEAGEGRVLSYLASAHEPVGIAGLSEVTSDDALSTQLARLMEKELVVSGERPGTCRLAVPSLEDSVLKSLSQAEIASLHRAWGKALAGEPDGNLQKIHHAIALKEEGTVIRGARSAAEMLSQEGRKPKALDLVNRALTVVTDADERSRLLRLKINLLNEMGRYEAALEICDEWFSLGAADESPELRAVKYWFITGLNHQNLGNHEEASARLRRCLKEGDHADEAHRVFLARAYSLLGVYEISRRRLKEAKELLRKGLEIVDDSGRRRAELCRNLAETFSLEGDWKKARDLFEKSIRHYREDHFDVGEFSVHLQEGNLDLSRGDLSSAGEAYAKAQAIADRREDEVQKALVESNRGILALKNDELAEALNRLARAQEIFELLGNQRDTAQNLKYLALVEASVGRFESAAKHIDELRKMARSVSEAPAMAHEAEASLLEIREGAGLQGDPQRLRTIFAQLPPELQVTFAERRDFQTLPKKTAASKKADQKTEDIVSILEDLADLNRELLEETDMDALLKRLMDKALEIAKAENGFLVLKAENEAGPLPGFRLAVARNMSKKALEKEEYLPSLSAVKRAMQTGLPFVTDNAVADPVFKNAKSVHLQQLKSIIALPVVGSEGVLGVFYLDHRFLRGLFEGETLAALKAFAGIAALALQKSRMIEALQSVNVSLSEEVELKTSEMGLMQRELKKSRMILKNEYSEIVGRSPKMLEVLSLVDRITEAKIPVWIFGESGTGKESIARAFHFNSSRAAKPFVSENCSALPENLLESELFGHKKGAFTHAVSDKRGLLEYANGGTIFLDEIADMSLGLQAKLLRFLQEGEIRPVGSSQMIKVDVRVVSASNRNLAELVHQKKFREDLFFRLNGVTVTLPPLRDRLEDLPLLAEHFLERIAHREKKPKCRIAQEAMQLLMRNDWPGNIRELQNTLETAVLFTDKGTVVPSSFQFKPVLLGQYAVPKPEVAKSAQDKPIPPDLEKILRAIRDQGFHRANAAKSLGMSRRNFYTKLEKFGVPRDFKSLKEYVDKYVG